VSFWCVSAHIHLAIEGIAGIQKNSVVSICNQLVKLRYAQTFVQVNQLQLDILIEQETSCFTTGSSVGFVIKNYRHSGNLLQKDLVTSNVHPNLI